MAAILAETIPAETMRAETMAARRVITPQVCAMNADIPRHELRVCTAAQHTA